MKLVALRPRVQKLLQRRNGGDDDNTLLIIVRGGMPGCEPSDEDIAQASAELKEVAKGYVGREPLIKVIGGLPRYDDDTPPGASR